MKSYFIAKFKSILRKSSDFWKEWIELFKELYIRIIDPIQSPNFVLYFFVIVIGIGGVGFWISFAKSSASAELFYSISTFSLTLASASFADVILYNNKQNSNEYLRKRAILTFPYTCIFFLTASSAIIALVLCGFFPNAIKTGARFSWVSLFLSIFLWWQVNSRNPHLSKAPFEPENTLGNTELIDNNDNAGFKV